MAFNSPHLEPSSSSRSSWRRSLLPPECWHPSHSYRSDATASRHDCASRRQIPAIFQLFWEKNKKFNQSTENFNDLDKIWEKRLRFSRVLLGFSCPSLKSSLQFSKFLQQFSKISQKSFRDFSSKILKKFCKILQLFPKISIKNWKFSIFPQKSTFF